MCVRNEYCALGGAIREVLRGGVWVCLVTEGEYKTCGKNIVREKGSDAS
jgi:hypothetical protein